MIRIDIMHYFFLADHHTAGGESPVHIVALSLEPANLAVLDQACTELRMTLYAAASPLPEAFQLDVVLAVFCEFGDRQPGPPPEEVYSHDTYPIAVLPSVSATGVLATLTQGWAFALASPLRAQRLVQCLSYLRDVAPPRAAQVLVLDTAGTLSSPWGSVQVTSAESYLLSRLASRDSQIVPREDLAEAADEDVLRVASTLKGKLADIRSGAKILKVPHLGYRLVGTVRHQASSLPVP